MTDATRTIIPRGTIYLGGQPHGFPPRVELTLPAETADALDFARHTMSAGELEQELKQEQRAAEKPAAA